MSRLYVVWFRIQAFGTGVGGSRGDRVLHESRSEQACRTGFTGHQYLGAATRTANVVTSHERFAPIRDYLAVNRPPRLRSGDAGLAAAGSTEGGFGSIYREGAAGFCRHKQPRVTARGRGQRIGTEQSCRRVERQLHFVRGRDLVCPKIRTCQCYATYRADERRRREHATPAGADEHAVVSRACAEPRTGFCHAARA